MTTTYCRWLTFTTKRNLAPDLLIAARARYNVHNHLLEQAGADIIITEEDRVGEALGEVTIERLRGGSTSAE